MCRECLNDDRGIGRRDLFRAAGVAWAGWTLGSGGLTGSSWAQTAGQGKKQPAVVRAAFLYPPTEQLKKEGYYSWPGSGFDAEGRQKQYSLKLAEIARKLGIQLVTDKGPLQGDAAVSRFISEVKDQPPDGLLLVPFKKSEYGTVLRIAGETGLPSVVLAVLGVFLMPQIVEIRQKPGLHVISSLEDFQAVEYGLNMIRTSRWMKDCRLLSIGGDQPAEKTVEKLGTQVRIVPMKRFTDIYKATESSGQVRELANLYLSKAKERREPSDADLLESARAYFACKRILEEEQGDALTMACLQGIQARQIPPPCMGFMSLRDEGIVAGCQNELDPALTMLLVQQLFGKPGFQQNAACDTERNLYFGSHCTCPTKLEGPGGPSMPYILRNHAEAGVGAVPQVLWPQGQEVTMAHYVSGKEPELIVYSGKVVACYDSPPAGGCRTNLALSINEVKAWEVKGMHQTVFAGAHAPQLRAWCRLFNVPAVS